MRIDVAKWQEKLLFVGICLNRITFDCIKTLNNWINEWFSTTVKIALATQKN